MKKYVNRENTPLKFHNFLKNVSLPLGLVYYSIMIIYNLIVYGIESLVTWQIIDYAVMVAAIVLIVIALRGLSKWEYLAWKCTIGLFSMILIYNILYLVILAVLNLSGGDEVMGALRAIVIDPFVIVYYYKRKLLFCNEESDCKKNKLLNEKKSSNFNFDKGMVCTKCGSKLIVGSSFCHKCGQEVIGKNYMVCIFDIETKILRKETREIDTIKFPPLKYAVNDTYYAIETIREDKKVRIYCEKKLWDKKIESAL